jgi:hypothetical protein
VLLITLISPFLIIFRTDKEKRHFYQENIAPQVEEKKKKKEAKAEEKAKQRNKNVTPFSSPSLVLLEISLYTVFDYRIIQKTQRTRKVNR